MLNLDPHLVSLRVKKVRSSLRTDIGRQALRRGVLLGSEHNATLRNLQFSTLIDVGANRGQFALGVLAEHPNVRVISFEPLAAPAETFQRLVNVLELGDSVIIHRLAVGDSTETAEMHISKSDDSSSLLSIGQQQVQTFPGTEEVSTAAVSVDTLDNCLETTVLSGPVLLKLDVQGAELRVLAGAASLLHFVDHVYVEVSFREFYEGQPLAGEIVSFLDASGFSLAAIGDVAMDSRGAALQADLLFSRNAADDER